MLSDIRRCVDRIILRGGVNRMVLRGCVNRVGLGGDDIIYWKGIITKVCFEATEGYLCGLHGR